MLPMPASPAFVTVGHLVRDAAPGDPRGFTLGGTVTFAAAQAHHLGLSAGIVTRCGPDLDLDADLPFAEVSRGVSSATTSFENVYSDAGRAQRVTALATAIQLEDVPDAWRAAPIVLLGPVFGEVSAEMAAWFGAKPQSGGVAAMAVPTLVGVSAQGWVRGLDAERRVYHKPWTGDPYWRGAHVLFASDEDLAGDEAELERWIDEVPIVAVTRSSRGARIWERGEAYEMEAFPAAEVDATGAGDTFATAFLIRLSETDDVAEAARFGAAAASLSVEGAGVAATADRAAIQVRIAAHPSITLHSA